MVMLRRHRISLVLLAALLVAGGCSQFGKPDAEYVLEHEVASGETAEEIARNYYGDPARARDIIRYNHLDDDYVASGDTLKVPMSQEDMVGLRQRERARTPFNRALELVERGSFLDASTMFKEALVLDPGFVDAYYNLGVTYQRMKAFPEAADAFEHAVKLDPRRAEYRYALGSVRFHQQEYAKALEAFRGALAINALHTKAQYSLATTLEKLGRDDEAIAAWRRYLEIDDDSEWARQARQRLEDLER